MKWVESHMGLWALVQAAGTIFAFIAILVSVMTYNDQIELRKHNALDQLIKSRNVSWWMARFIPGVVDRYNTGSNRKSDAQILKACLRRVSELSLANIEPAVLSEQFLDLEILGETVLGILDGNSLDANIDEIPTRLTSNIRIIDREIVSQGGKIVNNIATRD